ncbi:MAG: ABC transporter permease [Opitutaceae bacterium]
MKTLREVTIRLGSLFGRRRFEREMAEEMQAHLELQEAENRARGMDAAQARYEALRQFGGVVQVQERCREQRGGLWLRQALQDIVHAARLMRKNPGFTAVAVATLALGLGANITVFAIVSFFFLQPLPVPVADRLAALTRQNPRLEIMAPLSWRDFQDYRSEIREFDDALALMFRPAHLGLPGRHPDRTYLELVSGNYFSMLGVLPLHGRFFLPGEGERTGADPVVVLGHEYWKNNLGGDPGVIGQTLLVNGAPLRVIGIAPPSFGSVQWALVPSAFVPATMVGAVFPNETGALTGRDWSAFKVYGRLAPGATLAGAQAAADVVQRRLVAEHQDPAQERETRVAVRPERLSRPDPSVARMALFAAGVFTVLVALVLLIACANIANLMLARAAAREHEMGVRAALGASRGRLVRQLLTESVLLASVAGAVGLVLSSWVGQLLARFAPSGDVPIRMEGNVDARTVLFTIGVSVVAGLLTALLPALRATGVDVQHALRNAPRVGRSRHWWRNGLVVSQVVFSVVVLVSGGLFLRSLQRLSRAELGFRSDGVVLASIDPALNGYTPERTQRLVDELLARVRALPGVGDASLATTVPFGNAFFLREVRRNEESVDVSRRTPGEETVGTNSVEFQYFSTMGVGVLRGRGFVHGDTATSRPVVIINETLARRLWPDRDPLGRELVIGGDNVPREVVGIVRDGKYLMLGERPRGFVFAPLTQLPGGALTLHVRVATGRGGRDPLALVPELRGVLQELDPALPIFDVCTLDEHLRTSALGFMPLRLAAWLAGAQGALGLGLSVLGLYGVVAYTVTQRTREIGVRMALGASPGDVLRLVLRGGLRMTFVGLCGGLFGALLLARVLAGLLYGMNPFDGMVFGAVGTLLFAVTALACWLPARRAARVDPLIALRAE